MPLFLSLYNYEGIKWLTDWLFKWLPDWLFDSLSTFTWLIGPNLQLSITWPISSHKYWIYAALKHFILKEHKTIKRGSEFQNSWQGNLTVAWITGKYYQHISRWKGLQQSKLGEASGTLKSIGVDWCDWWLIERLLQGTKCESQVKRWLNRPSSDWPWHKTRLLVICHTLNPLSPTSDQHQFSPKDIHTLAREKVMRVNKMITKEKIPWSFIKFSQLILKGNVQRPVWRICTWILGLKGLSIILKLC